MTNGDGKCSPNIPVLEVEGLEHKLTNAYGQEVFTVTVEDRITINPGSFAALLGKSGCGKTTLLTILGLLRCPHAPEDIGCFKLDGHDIADLWIRNDQREIERLRRECIGFALQSGDLLSSLKVRENIAVPLQLNNYSWSECITRVDELIAAFELDGKTKPEEESEWWARAKRLFGRTPSNSEDSNEGGRLADARINKLSGGEFQRVVLARSIAHRPRIAFVDEPTSALNAELARNALVTLKASMHDGDMPGAVVMITHDEDLADEFADTVIRMEPDESGGAGRVVEVENRSS